MHKPMFAHTLMHTNAWIYTQCVCMHPSCMTLLIYSHAWQNCSHLIGMFCFGLLHTQSSCDWKLEFQHCELESVWTISESSQLPRPARPAAINTTDEGGVHDCGITSDSFRRYQSHFWSICLTITLTITLQWRLTLESHAWKCYCKQLLCHWATTTR